MENKIIHEEQYQQFTLKLGEEDAELAYALPAAGEINFTHTFVPAVARGKGIATKLIEAGLAYAHEQGLKVKASCPVVARYLQAHPQQP
ncbi:GNAT family N-acetyltransferase [Pontibacter chitinilyticus]|uniref:GNAT family N-acetyltransferase n=1 Tax=Pontibacter chitinilyticus TaxID=2674989 RepID=UPI00321AC381